MSQSAFILSEGTLNLPGALQDHSINVLKLPDHQATLVITRGWDVAAEQQAQWFDQQLAKVKRNMKKVVIGEITDTLVGGRAAREVALSFENQHLPVHERLAIVMLDDHLLAFTLSRMTPFDEAALALWQAIKNDLQLTGSTEA